MLSATCPATSIGYNTDRFTRLLPPILNIPHTQFSKQFHRSSSWKVLIISPQKQKWGSLLFSHIKTSKEFHSWQDVYKKTALKSPPTDNLAIVISAQCQPTSMQSPNLPRTFLGCDHHRKVSKMNHRGDISKPAGNCDCITGGRGALSQPCLRVRGQQATWTLLSSSFRRKLPGDSSQVSYGGRSHSPLPSPSSVLSSDPWLWLWEGRPDPDGIGSPLPIRYVLCNQA